MGRMRHRHFGIDKLLTTLACMLSKGSIVLAASSNDNGLLHQEMVDFELPEASAGRLGPLRSTAPKCDEPFGWVGADRLGELAPGRVGSAEAKRRRASFLLGACTQVPNAGRAPRASEAAAVRAVDARRGAHRAILPSRSCGICGAVAGVPLPLPLGQKTMVIRSAGRGVRPSRPPPRTGASRLCIRASRRRRVTSLHHSFQSM